MKKTRYREEQIAFPLRQAETGAPVGEVIRKMGIFTQTSYRWKNQSCQMGEPMKCTPILGQFLLVTLPKHLPGEQAL